MIDKDIIVRGNKIYGPETCCFVPVELNSMFTKSNSIRGSCPIGVHKQGTKYVATLFVKGKQKYLGIFDTPKDAFNTYKINKEENIKRLAKGLKPLISKRLFEILINYTVEITD